VVNGQTEVVSPKPVIQLGHVNVPGHPGAMSAGGLYNEVSITFLRLWSGLDRSLRVCINGYAEAAGRERRIYRLSSR
jgi:hypothetical protein